MGILESGFRPSKIPHRLTDINPVWFRLCRVRDNKVDETYRLMKEFYSPRKGIGAGIRDDQLVGFNGALKRLVDNPDHWPDLQRLIDLIGDEDCEQLICMRDFARGALMGLRDRKIGEATEVLEIKVLQNAFCSKLMKYNIGDVIWKIRADDFSHQAVDFN